MVIPAGVSFVLANYVPRRSANVQGAVRRQRVLRYLLVLAIVAGTSVSRVQADPVGLQWPQAGGPGTPVYLTYSYSNLLDGAFLLISPSELRAATEEALSVWAMYAPLNFIEVPDAGPAASDEPYSAVGVPQIRVGHHEMTELAHAYYPGTDGLAGDVHVATGIPWTIGEGHWNFLEAITHEIGHALGLGHELDEPAVMNPSYPSHRFSGLGSAFLFPADITAIQAVYGSGAGSVRPLAPTPLDPAPEPATFLLVAGGILVLSFARSRRLRVASVAPRWTQDRRRTVTR